MTKQLDISLLNSDILGVNGPDPLRCAFSRKTSAHAGGKVEMVVQENE